MSVFELFPLDDAISECEITEILSDEAQDFEMVMTPDENVYLKSRRVLLGPAADIHHPDFGRPNRPEETYGIFYKVKERLVSRILELDDEGDKSYFPIHSYEIHEYVFDVDNNLVSVQDLSKSF